jgi:erythromycin esterase-like protein
MPANSLLKNPTKVKDAPRALLEGLHRHLQALKGAPNDYDSLLNAIGHARFVLIGEASHGTHEFYRERVKITQRLILDKGFTAVTVEADWPDAWRVNRYVRGLSVDQDAREALSGFERFPSWMWRNTEVCEFVEWLRQHNSGRNTDQQVGFYGMDLYSLFRSMEEVLAYLDRTDPVSAQRARSRYACFDHVGQDSQAYGYAAAFGMARSCEDEVVQQLSEMMLRLDNSTTAPRLARDDYFHAQQNARLVRNAEAYYRSMFRGRVSSWNLRDSHMVDTLVALSQHLAVGATPPRMAVWAHNSHLGDASVTEMGDRGEWNVGKLMREHYGSEAFLIGMSTHHGTVTAVSEWDELPQRKHVRPGLEGSWEAVFHQASTANFMLLLKDNPELQKITEALRLQRAIGVIYRPETERQSHYFFTHLARQFDALVHWDETHALEPIDKGLAWQGGEAPETYPSGI